MAHMPTGAGPGTSRLMPSKCIYGAGYCCKLRAETVMMKESQSTSNATATATAPPPPPPAVAAAAPPVLSYDSFYQLELPVRTFFLGGI